MQETKSTRWFDEVTVGTELNALSFRPTTVQLFRFSAVTWNAHRIHYDADYARSEGYPDVLVQSHLHGCFLARTVLDWAGVGAQLWQFSWQNRHRAVAGDTLICTGRVTDCRADAQGTGLIECSLEERNGTGVLCAPATAVLELPRKMSPERNGVK